MPRSVPTPWSGGFGGVLPGGSQGSHDEISYQPPSVQAGSKFALTTANQAHALPIAWGTVKLSTYLIEAHGPPREATLPAWQINTAYPAGSMVYSDIQAWRALRGGTSITTDFPVGQGSLPPFWTQNTAYAFGDIVQNPNLTTNYVYQCSKAGTSSNVGTGPQGTGSGIVDAGATWQWIGETANNLADPSQGNFQIEAGANGLIWQWLGPLPYKTYYISMLCAVCEGEVHGAVSLFWDQEVYVCPSATELGKLIKLYKGPDALGQAPTGGFNSSGYQHTVLIGPNTAAGRNIPTGTRNEIPSLALELQAVMFGSTYPDVSPADIVNDLLTHTRRGCGWPGSRVDTTTITGIGASSLRTYCDAAGFRFSLAIDSQRSALSILADILNATNSDAFWSQGALKIVPLGDLAITSPVYGATNYTPPNVAQYNLTETDFIEAGDGLPVQVQRNEDVDCYNDIPVQYVDRGKGLYQQNIVEDPDMTDVEKRGGMWRGPTLSLPVIFNDGTPAIALSRIAAQRSLNVRNTYTFKLPWRYLLLEPCDIVTVPMSALAIDGDPNTLVPVRITSMREDANFQWTVTAEDYPAGVAASGAYSPQAGDGYQPNNIGAGVPNSFGTGTLTSRDPSNLWPNPTSENNPPIGFVVSNDGSQPEWDYRSNLGAGAHSGTWVRALPGASSTFNLVCKVPCTPDQIAQFSTWAKEATASSSAGIDIIFYDSVGNIVGSVTANTVLTTWTLLKISMRAPAGTVWAAAVLVGGAAGSTGHFDEMLFKVLPPAGPAGGFYSAGGPIALDCTYADQFEILANGNFTQSAPTSPYVGQEITVKVKNISAGNVVVTWNAVFKIAGGNVWAAIVTATSRSITFHYDGTHCVEVSRTPADVPN